MRKMSFEKLFTQCNPNYAFLLKYMRCALGVDEVRFSDINTMNMDIFRKYMEGEKAGSTLKTYYAVIKSIIRKMAKDGLVKSDSCCDSLLSKATPCENVFCTEEEIARMDAYFDRLLKTGDNKCEQDCLCLFLLENITGARTSDCERLSFDNIRDGKISYISKKTKQKSVMPVHSKLEKYLSHMPEKEYSRMTKNRVIKRVARKCGITEKMTLFYRGKLRTMEKCEFMASHTGRRDFATLLSMRGAPINEICQFMNHRQNITQTARYIVPDLEHVSKESMSFFNG